MAVWDAIIIGGGPAGAIAGMALCGRGRSAIILEKSQFPRFHVGESFVPATLDRLRELGLEADLRKLPHVPKFGAEFHMGHGRSTLRIGFSDGFTPSVETFNIERSIFDQMLLAQARSRGAEVREGTGVREIVSLADGAVRVRTDCEEFHGRYLLDASGTATVIGRHLGTRKPAEESFLRKVAYTNHFDNVQRAAGPRQGDPLIAMADDAWFWIIPLNEKRSSVGAVLDADLARQISREQNVAPDRMLAWCIQRCPAIQNRMTAATPSATDKNQVMADFSYSCKPFAGEGYFLIGDAATFMDPIFSTGASIAANSAVAAAEAVHQILAGRVVAGKARQQYIARIETSTGTLFQLIRQYYNPAFRDLFMSGTGPLAVHRAVIGVLAGNVFPRPPWKIRWRLPVFNLFVKIQARFALVPRQERFSILPAAQPAPPVNLPATPSR